MLKKIFSRRGMMHIFLTAVLVFGVIGVIAYIKMPPHLPRDAIHKDISSNFVCLGCHNNGNNGGSSLTFHYDNKICIKCHSQ